MSQSRDRLISIYSFALKSLVILLLISNVLWLIVYTSSGSYYKKLYEQCDRSKGCWSYEIQYFQNIDGSWTKMAAQVSPLYERRPLANLMLSKYLSNDYIYEVTHPTMRISLITDLCDGTIDTVDIIKVYPK